MQLLSALITAALMLLPLQASMAGMYQWTDANGQTEYGEHPPAGSNARRITAPAASSNPTTKRQTLKSQLKQFEADKAKREGRDTEYAREQKIAETAKSNCETAKSNLKVLQQGGSRLKKMPDGNFKRLTQEDKQPMIDEANKQIRENCE